MNAIMIKYYTAKRRLKTEKNIIVLMQRKLLRSENSSSKGIRTRGGRGKETGLVVLGTEIHSRESQYKLYIFFARSQRNVL